MLSQKQISISDLQIFVVVFLPVLVSHMVFIEHQQVSVVNHIKNLLEVLCWGHHLLEVPRTFIYFLFVVASLPYRFHSLTSTFFS